MNISELRELARARLSDAAWAYLEGGSDDQRTLAANGDAFGKYGTRCRRLVDVSHVDTRVRLFDQTLEHPIALAPVGFQRMFHDEGECAAARGARSTGALQIASTVSSCSIAEIARARGAPVWFQLYPTTDRGITRELLRRAEAAGCPVVAPTVDVPVFGNREGHVGLLQEMLGEGGRMGNFEGLDAQTPINDPSLTWEFIDWLRANTSMKILLKGIVTAEDTRLAAEHGVDGLLVSNHGGRQEESLRASIDCLPEVVAAAPDSMPVLFDGGIRRGTDALKALALGARAVCIGRPYVYGLTADGADGVARSITILREELIRAMQLAGAPSIEALGPEFIERI